VRGFAIERAESAFAEHERVAVHDYF
jgi:hypothetical protein